MAEIDDGISSMSESEIRELRESLRYKPDMVITNCFDERVWLTEAYQDGKRIGITDCCLESEPCDYHNSLKNVDINLGDLTA